MAFPIWLFVRRLFSLWLFPGRGETVGTAYVLTADAGAWTWTGTPATCIHRPRVIAPIGIGWGWPRVVRPVLLREYTLVASPGIVPLSGARVALRASRSLWQVPAAWSVVGESAALWLRHILAAGVGVWRLRAAACDMRARRTLGAAGASVDLQGEGLVARAHRALGAGAATAALRGEALVARAHRALAAGAATAALRGEALVARAHRALAVDTGAFPAPAWLFVRRDAAVRAGPGDIAVFVFDASLLAARLDWARLHGEDDEVLWLEEEAA